MFNVVATPIGNMQDVTLRAIETLKNSDVILCEDTRHSLPFLKKFGIKAKLVSCHKFNETERIEYILSLIDDGKEVSLITDAGTPVVSDPGYVVIKALREKNIPITSIPGACALINAVVLSGINCENFAFFGFIPDGKRKKELLKRAEKASGALVFYISPHSVNEDVKALYQVLGNRKGVILREMTKLHEEAIPITLSENPEIELCGEMVLVLEEKKESAESFEALSPMEHLLGYINSGMEKNEAIKKVAKERGVPKNEIYKLLVEKK